jgi:hypothetical protein
MMTIQKTDSDHLSQMARQIKTRVPVILSRWGLPPKFNRWRLAQDAETGLAVLFAVLNNNYITKYTTIPFSDYFDPRLLHDLENDLHVQVVFCNSDGLRYAFILDRGSIDVLPTYIDFPITEGDKLFVGVVYKNKPIPRWINHPQAEPVPPINGELINDDTLFNQGVTAFLKVFDTVELKDNPASILSSQGKPKIMVIDAEGFKKRATEPKTNP